MKRGILEYVLSIVALSMFFPSICNAEQWQIKLKEISIETRKANGKKWDAGNGSPDVFGSFCAGVRQRGRCVCSKKKINISKRQDQFKFNCDYKILVDKDPGQSLCVKVELTDKDMFNNDPIGRADAEIAAGESKIKAGQATLTIMVKSTEPQFEAEQVDVKLPEPPSPRKEDLYRITISSAQIKPKRVDGSTWDAPVHQSNVGKGLVSSLFDMGLKLVPGGQYLSPFVSALTQGNDEKPSKGIDCAPDPRVKIETDSAVYLTPFVNDTYSPSWETRFLVTRGDIEGDSIKFEVLDQDGRKTETIGSELVPASKLFAKEILRLSFGNVKKLLVQVTRVQEKDTPLYKSVKIDKAGSWQKTGLKVIGGQTIQARAKGNYCLSGTTCVGPNGYKKIQFPIDESRDHTVNLGQIIAVIGQKIYPIGIGSSFISESTGKLLIGVASKTMTSGHAEVDINVYYPIEKVRNQENH